MKSKRTSRSSSRTQTNLTGIIVPPASPGGQRPSTADAILTVTPWILSAFAKIFLTIPEASAVSGLSENFLKNLISTNQLVAVEDDQPKIRRSDLENLKP